MAREIDRIFFQVPVEDEGKIDEYLVELQAQGIIKEVRQGEGELVIITETETREVPVLHYYLTVRDGEAQAQEVARTLYARKIVPAGREWFILFGVSAPQV